MNKFNPHKKKWFLNRVDQIVYRHDGEKLFKAILIVSRKHAEAMFDFHNFAKINYEDHAG